MKEKALNFEAALKELEVIAKKLEDSEIPLDKAIEYFEKGMKLSKFCNDKLQEAENKVKVIINSNENAKPTLEDFDESNAL